MKRYIAIDLLALKQHKLSLEEWTLLENIYFMSNNDFGWCYASKNTLREIIQVSNGQIYKIINKLIENGLLLKNTDTGYLKVTQKWVQISSGEGIQKMENNSPKNGNTPIQKMDTKIDTTKEEKKVEEKNTKKRSEFKYTPKDVIDFYAQNISSKNMKIKEKQSFTELSLRLEDMEKILIGLKNYAKLKPAKECYIINLHNFIKNKAYEDYQVLEQDSGQVFSQRNNKASVENTKAMISMLFEDEQRDTLSESIEDCEIIE